ncbi:MAG: M61 family metallopeptidase [Bacteroidota bacterium]|jgi:predicted metalloprotease with PDZ domain
MHYKVSVADAIEHFIQLEYTIPHIHQDFIEVQLPAWRPGRYELQNFAKNVRWFQVYDEQNNPVKFQKVTKDRWHIHTKGIKTIRIDYQYYANQPDAGACYADANYLYINPVHCFMYVEGRMDESYTIDFMVNDDVVVAGQLNQIGKHSFTAPNFDYLADSPIIASNTMEHHQIQVNNTNIHFWFQGKHPFDITRLKSDTAAYTQTQTAIFGELPCSEYHFLYLIHPYPARHGVEHLNSTVIAMGQLPDQTEEEFYHDLLAISSHELFHLWNIKRIRPAEMLPYDFTKENYSTLGYVYEGVTTYYGDLMLLESGVWNWEQYAESFSSDLKRHFNNPARNHYSVAESSWDTWLDGYVSGILARKVSIYIEGMIAAFIADTMIIEGSKGKYRLHDVMRALYDQCVKKHIGYTEELYKNLLEQYGQQSFDTYFEKIIHGIGAWDEAMNKACARIGCELIQKPNGDKFLSQINNPTKQQLAYFSAWLGMK